MRIKTQKIFFRKTPKRNSVIAKKNRFFSGSFIKFLYGIIIILFVLGSLILLSNLKTDVLALIQPSSNDKIYSPHGKENDAGDFEKELKEKNIEHDSVKMEPDGQTVTLTTQENIKVIFSPFK